MVYICCDLFYTCSDLVRGCPVIETDLQNQIVICTIGAMVYFFIHIIMICLDIYGVICFNFVELYTVY